MRGRSANLYCARRAALVLPVEGAPLVFKYRTRHRLRLELTREDGSRVELPARPDAPGGGFVDTSPLGAAKLTGPPCAACCAAGGGFEEYVGPEFQLAMPEQRDWRTAGADGTR